MFETNFNDDHKHKNIKCYNSRSISNNNENEFNYPNNTQIIYLKVGK